MIAAVAIRHDVMLLHNDRDFDPIEKHCGLKVVKVIRKPARGSR
jgi:predicted nucleic acid-binding protein